MVSVNQPKSESVNRPESELEIMFDYYWRVFAGQAEHLAPKPEHRFDDKRKWRFDRAWILGESGVAVELEGGVYSGGRHTRGSGYRRDCEKYNAAVAKGWRVFRFTRDMLTDNPELCINQVLSAVLDLKDR